MTALSFERLLKSSRLAIALPERDSFIADRSIRLTRPDRERFEGKVSKSAGSAGGANGLGLAKKLSQKLRKRAPRSAKVSGAMHTGAVTFDQRQRAVVKIHYFNHAGTGAAALKAHAKYVARDAARHGPQPEVAAGTDKEEPRRQARAQGAYLEREGARGIFYDARAEGIDGGSPLETWATADRRHFRLILSAEEGARLRDVQAYTREVMARAGAALGTKLSWVAVDHHDTDNPHTHIIVRGRRANGQDLVLPRDFIKHGLRSIARDVATEWLGKRTRDQERQALEREARRHAPTRLDPMLAAQAPERAIRIGDLQAPNGDPSLTQALKERVRELARMGLAEETGRGVFCLKPDWRDQLKSLELHLDIRKRLMRDQMERTNLQRDLHRQIPKGLLDR